MSKSSNTDLDEPGIDSADLDLWTVSEPPPGFSDRVLAARERGPAATKTARTTRQKRFGAVAGVALVGAGLLAVWNGTAQVAIASGSVAASQRQRVVLGQRGVAVAEPGAHFEWQVADSGNARVEQSEGNVFYRVDKGGAFVVATPNGQISVTGTCFRVEIEDMKTAKTVAIGAALGAVVVVSVYEGRVLVAGGESGARSVEAGERVQLANGKVVSADDSVAQAESEIPSAPASDATREQLLSRDELQRAEIADLRRKVRALEAGAGERRVMIRGEEDEGGTPWFSPSKEQLARFAKDCRVRYDLPPMMGDEPFQIGTEMMSAANLSPEQVAAANRSLALLTESFAGEVRQLYVEATGDTQGADALSAMSMAQEIRDKANRGDLARIQQTIARERAGLAAPPADSSQLIPIERYYRLMARLGDDTERLLADAIGADAARKLREANGGWGQRMEMAGCPESGRMEIEADR